MKENNENDLISRRALYDKCVELEQEALKVVLSTDDKIEKLIWNAVLIERSAFKFSVADAPAFLSNQSAGTEMTAKAEMLEEPSKTSMSWEGKCSNCGSYTIHEMNYCFGCGAKLYWDK